MVIEVIIVLLLIVANGLLSMSELAVVSSRPARLQRLADRGNRGAAVATQLAAQPNRFLSTVQIGITLIGILNGTFGGATLAGPVSDALAKLPLIGGYSEALGPVVVVLVITYLSLVIGELVPKRLAMRNPEGVAAAAAPALKTLSRLMTPVAILLAKSTEILLRLFGSPDGQANRVSEEEIELLIKQGTEEGVFHKAEQRLVSGVFDVADRTAGELMTPRHAVIFLDLAKSEEENRERMHRVAHSRYPVCDGSLDNLVGLISTRELWRRQLAGESTAIRDAMQPALFLPEISPIFTAIEQMRRQQEPMALLIDEYGGFDGLITFNDILSDLVGEIDDPTLIGIRGASRRPDGSWLIDGVFPAHELRELLDIDELPGEDAGRFETISGFLMDQLGHIPTDGETLTWQGRVFEVVDMDGNRIDKILVSDAPTAETDPEP